MSAYGDGIGYRGEYDVLIGINLLREGLDLPEVSLVAILDADKEGFLRSQGSLIQTITDLHILSLTEDAGQVIGFEGFPSATNPLPNPLIEAISLDLANGDTSEIVNLGTDTGPMFGVAPEVAAAPEPASLALLGTSLAAVAVRFRSVKRRT